MDCRVLGHMQHAGRGEREFAPEGGKRRGNGDHPSLRRMTGYLTLEDYGPVGDGGAVADRNGGLPWLCCPRFHSPALQCGIPDRALGGALTVAPEDRVKFRRFYEAGTGVPARDARPFRGGRPPASLRPHRCDPRRLDLARETKRRGPS